MMRFKAGAVAALILGSLAGAVPAQTVPEDAMEVQRCIWRCLDRYPGAESPEYQACVATDCAGEAPQDAPAQGAVWRVAPAEDGRGQAAVARDDAMGTELWILCTADGRERAIEIRGAEGPDAVLQLNIDGTAIFPLPFRDMGGRARAVLAPPYAELEAISAGHALALLNGAGYSVFSASLRGSAAALSAACP